MSSLPGLLIIVLGLYLMHLGFNGASWLPIEEAETFGGKAHSGSGVKVE